MNSEQDILILESIFSKIGLHEIFKQLSFGDLKKRGGYRFKIVADKINQGVPFNLSDGDSTTLQFLKPEYQQAFEQGNADKIKNFSPNQINLFKFFKDDLGSEYSISDLLKDPDLGGKGAGSGTVVEDYNLKLLNSKIQERIEQNNGEPINVLVNGETYYNIMGAETQRGYPKADFYLFDENNQPQVWISHKKAGGKEASANDFIRWSGYTIYANEPEIEEFNNALKAFLLKNNLPGIPPSTKFVAPIKDDFLIHRLIYGPEYGSGKYSKDNVNTILQGEIRLVPQGPNLYKLDSEHTISPPSIPQEDYYPYLVASYRHDRNMFGIRNNEAIVMTKVVATSATNLYELIDGEFIRIKPL
jgi:hypothetical protein